jgi:hypothetical protein
VRNGEAIPSKSPIQSRENTERSNFGVGAGALDSPFGEWIGFGLYKHINIFLKGAAMPDIQKSMKLSLAFGLSGAVILPVLYEVYANISAAAGLVLIAVWAVCAGTKFSALKFKEAFMGMVCTLAYAGILGVICYIVIHPKVSDMLNRRSVYFQLSLKQQAYFVLYAVLISLCMFLVWGGIFGVKKAIERFRLNREKTGEYIDKAFDDDEDML